MAFIRYFTAVPRIVLNDPSCSSTDKLVMGVINSLSNNKEYCYASNDYFSKELNVGTKTISNSLSKLKKLGFIYIEYVKKDRHIYMNPKIVMEENSKVSEKNLPVMVEENYQQKRKDYKKKNTYEKHLKDALIQVEIDKKIDLIKYKLSRLPLENVNKQLETMLNTIE